jgi:hypothetical protein
MELDPGIHIVMHFVLSLKPGVTNEEKAENFQFKMTLLSPILSSFQKRDQIEFIQI